MEGSRRAYLDQERGCICLQPIRGGDHFYEINTDQCRTPEQIIEWMEHLLTKNWGREIMPDFLRIAAAQCRQ